MSAITPDYTRIRSHIIGLAATKNEAEPMQRIPTERELCKMLDTSRTTLRKALKQLEEEGFLIRKPHFGTFINNEMRSTVDYFTSQHKVVGIVLGGGELTFLTAFFMRILARIMDGLANNGCTGRMLNVGDNPKQELEFLISTGQLDGVVFLCPPPKMIPCLKSMVKNGFPAVVCQTQDIEEAAYCVYNDEYQSGYLVTEYLLREGHRSILYLENASSSKLRLERKKKGAQDAFRKAGAEWNEKLWHCSVSINAAEKIRTICEYSPDFTAVHVAEALHDPVKKELAGKPEIPVIQICGYFDENNPGFQITPSVDKLGETTAEILLKLVRSGTKAVKPCHIEVGFETRLPKQSSKNKK